MILPGAEPFFLPGGKCGVLLIHGFTGLPAEMLLLGQYLNKRGYTVLGVRLAGHATTVEDMSHMTGEDWMDSVRDGYALLSGICEEISAVGHSMGGLLALRLAAEKPLERLVTLAAPAIIHPGWGAEKLPPREECVGQYVPKARRNLKNVPEAVNRTYRKMPLLCVHELFAVMEAAKKCMEKIELPILIVHSYGDHTADPGSADYIYEHVKSSEKDIFWLEKAGHLLPLEPERELVFARTAAFLDEVG